MDENIETRQMASSSEMLSIVGEYGNFQKMVNVMFCIMILPSGYQVLISYFAADDPPWKCIQNSSICKLNGTLQNSDSRRCAMPRTQWEYTQPHDYSVVTYFDVNCGNQWLIELPTSVMFIGWFIGHINCPTEEIFL